MTPTAASGVSEMTTLGDPLPSPEVRKQPVQVRVERGGEVLAEARSLVAGLRETEPCLLDLLEPVPGVNETRGTRTVGRLVPEKNEILDDLSVQGAVDGTLAVEQKERVDE